MSSQTGKYSFLPWVKTGLGALVSNNENDLNGPRSKIQAKLTIRSFDGNNNQFDNDIPKEFILYGPGDIQGVLSNIIIRTEPGANSLNFEPNYFPFIEFSQPDFPWKYTPAKPGGAQLPSRLSPWLSLLALEENEFIRIPSEPGLLPKIEIGDPSVSLPDLKQSWACAHTQIIQDISDSNSLSQVLRTAPFKVISRILCFRKLKPNTRYTVFLVPTFEPGRRAGLGLPSEENIKGTSFAWSEQSTTHYLVPVYYQWSFTTGPGGDFESLARKLEYRELPKEVGIKKLDVSDSLLSVGSEVGFNRPLFFGGALWSLLAEEFVISSKKLNVHKYQIDSSATQPDPEDPSPEEIKEFIMKTKEIIDLGERLAWSFVKHPDFTNECQDPIISPPLYGKWHARKKLVSNISDDYKDPLWVKSLELTPPQMLLDEIRKYSPNENLWIEELNLDPTNRVAAGLGAAVVQDLQEELMESAWDQAGQLRETNKHLRNSQLAREISSNVYERSFQKMEQNTLITMFSSFHSKVAIKHENKSASAKQWFQESRIPRAIFSPPFTKISKKVDRLHNRRFDFKSTISSEILDRFKRGPNIGSGVAALEIPRSGPLLTLDYLVDSPVLHRLNLSITEDGFRGQELTNYLQNAPVEERQIVENMENSIPNTPSTTDEPQITGELLGDVYDGLVHSLDPKLTIESKILLEVTRPERKLEETRDKLDIINAYPEFRRPMYEPLRNLSEDLIFPGIKNIPQNTIGLLKTNPTFINSYMVGLNHEMARELLWREFPTDLRGSYFRQFWDASTAVERENQMHLLQTGTVPSEQKEEEIVEKYFDIPAIHRWNESEHQDLRRVAQREGAEQSEVEVLLIKGELLLRYPGTIIYATRAKPGATNIDKPVVSMDDDDIKLPVFRGTVSPDITFLGFDIKISELMGSGDNSDPGYFFIIQEQPSEPRFGIDSDNDVINGNTPPDTWNDLNWKHVESSLGVNNYIDMNGPLNGLKLENGVTWGLNSADNAYIFMQRPFRIVVHARDLLNNLDSGGV